MRIRCSLRATKGGISQRFSVGRKPTSMVDGSDSHGIQDIWSKEVFGLPRKSDACDLISYNRAIADFLRDLVRVFTQIAELSPERVSPEVFEELSDVTKNTKLRNRSDNGWRILISLMSHNISAVSHPRNIQYLQYSTKCHSDLFFFFYY